MRNPRTRLFGIGGALVALAVLLTPISATGGSAHPTGASANTPTMRPMTSSSVAMRLTPQALASPVTQTTVAPMLIPSVHPLPTAVGSTTAATTSPLPLMPASESSPVPSTPLLRTIQNNGGDHDSDNNGGVSDGDGEA